MRILQASLLAATCLFVGQVALTQAFPQQPAAQMQLAQAKETIVDIAAGNEDFSTLVADLNVADLVEALSGDGPFTVFAPTNDAFAALPEGTVEMLLKPENKDKLIAILKYHVVSGDITSDKIESGMVETLAGSDVKIKVKRGGKVKVNDAKVISADK